MKTAYNKLIEKCAIEESYGVDINDKLYNKIEKRLNNLLKQFNIMKI